jgi:hypothetical protein
MYCQDQPLGKELKIDQQSLSRLNYEDYQQRLRQKKDSI